MNKKIDLQHSQEFSDIVGGVVSADHVEDETGGRVDCVGELYIGESEQARLAHTRGSVGAGADSLTPGPVLDIIDVRQGGTVYRRGIDWQQSGNQVDWLGSGVEPAIGTTYQVRWTYTGQLDRGVDYVEGGWFGTPGYPAAGVEYFYFVSAFRMDWNGVDEENEFREYFYPQRELVPPGATQDGG